MLKIYYDGVDIIEFIDQVDGVTTNTSFIYNAGITDYNQFISESLTAASGKPVSFQVTSSDLNDIYEQSKFISNQGGNVYIKIPIILPNGSFSTSVIASLSKEGVKVNATCVYTIDQLYSAYDALETSRDSIISLFAGGLNDCKGSVSQLFNKAVELKQNATSKQILYAGCQSLRCIHDAQDYKADIITVPGSVLNKLDRVDKTARESSILKSATFFEYGSHINFTY